jgi:hypothetical protein
MKSMRVKLADGSEIVLNNSNDDATDEQMQTEAAKAYERSKAGAPPPGYVRDQWEDMPEERTDFFATRRRQPQVVRSKGWAATVGRRLR